jgi:NAD-dependent SIR2 family protein deacetylase
VNENINKARELIQKADAVLITAGAGMGVDSGLPDFRGNEGFWKAYPPIRKLGLSFSEMANPAWFEKKPTLAWAFYGHRLNLYRETIPHDGFSMLLELVRAKQNDYFIFTSNVDGQFQKAGFDPEKIYEIYEIHGSIHHFQCTKSHHGIWDARKEVVDVDVESFQAKNLPQCPTCGALARPNILMFGDWEWDGTRSNDQEENYHQWLSHTYEKKLVIIEVGAGLAVPSVRMEGEHIVHTYPNAQLIRINPRDDQIGSDEGVSIALGGLEGIESIVEE